MKPKRIRIIIFSPLPPQRSGIADYSAGLLPGLQMAYECTVVVEDGGWSATVPAGVQLIQASEYDRLWEQFADLLHVYHVGNSRDHVYMLEPMVRTPGLVVLHDAGLHHLTDCVTLERGNIEGYEAALTAEYGWAGRKLARQAVNWGLRGLRIHTELPMIRGLVGPARGVVAHSRTVADCVRRFAPDADVTIVNHYVVEPSPSASASKQGIRARFGVANDELLLVSLGFVTRAKQIDLVLRALADRVLSLPAFHYLIIGERRPDELDVERLAVKLGLADRVTLVGYLAIDDVDAVLSTADLLINLRYPTLGETSGTLMRALAHGVCTIVTNVGSFRDFPGDVLVRLGWDSSIQARLGSTLEALARDSKTRRQIGKAGARWSKQKCSLEGAVDAYRVAIARAAARPPVPWRAGPHAWKTPPRSKPPLVVGSAPLWFTAGFASPLGPCRVLAVLAQASERVLLAEVLNTSLDVDLLPPPGSDGWALLLASLERRTVDLAVVSVPAALVPSDPLALLRRLNALLGFGGMLVFDVDGETAGSDVLLQEESGQTVLEWAGFDVQANAAASPPRLTETPGLVSYRRCWRALKVSEFTTPPPPITSGLVP